MNNNKRKGRRRENNGHPWKQHEESFQRWIVLVADEPRSSKAEMDAAVEEFYPAVVKTAAGILSSPSFRWIRTTGLDVANEWYADLVQSGFKGYDRSRPFFCYAHRVLVRKCLNIRRREKYRRVRNFKVERISPDDGPAHAAANRELFQQLRKILPVLTPDEFRAVHRKYFLGDSSADIAKEFGMTASRFDAWTHTIRMKLRRLFRDADNDGEGTSE